MDIDTGNAVPKCQPTRRTPFAAREEISRQLTQMQEQGVIQPSCSPWASPVVLVRKKDGSLRFCVDYRGINSVTKPDQFPLPRIDDLLDQLGHCKYFSTLDLAAGYWQVQMSPSSREKTAFTTHKGLYEFNVMPFGLRNAPAIFQRIMQHILMSIYPQTGPTFVSAYLDDIIIFSENFDDHLLHLRQVIQCFADTGLKFKPSKCHFICQEVEYLGHLITPSGILPNPVRVSAVQRFPEPSSVKEVRQFVGLTSYYRRFIKGFARIAQPLHNLTQKGACFSWSEQCQAAFQQLKNCLTNSPVLCYPTFNQSFILETDASQQGLGAVLSQEQADGKLHPVAYASRALSPAEKRYAITDLETLAVVWAVTHFHAYLYGHDVLVYTDHSAVRAVLETPSASGKHARWCSKLFSSGLRSIKIVYRPGKENTNADALSRCPVAAPHVDVVGEHSVQISQLESSNAPTITELLDVDPATLGIPQNIDLACEQMKDSSVNEMIQFLTNGTLPDDPQHSRKIAAQAPSFTIVDNILYYLDSATKKDRKRCVVPSHLRQQVMEEYHSGPLSGHFSGEKLYKTLVHRWWWQGMYTDVLNHCSSCPVCHCSPFWQSQQTTSPTHPSVPSISNSGS